MDNSVLFKEVGLSIHVEPMFGGLLSEQFTQFAKQTDGVMFSPYRGFVEGKVLDLIRSAEPMLHFKRFRELLMNSFKEVLNEDEFDELNRFLIDFMKEKA